MVRNGTRKITVSTPIRFWRAPVPPTSCARRPGPAWPEPAKTLLLYVCVCVRVFLCVCVFALRTKLDCVILAPVIFLPYGAPTRMRRVEVGLGRGELGIIWLHLIKVYLLWNIGIRLFLYLAPPSSN